MENFELGVATLMFNRDGDLRSADFQATATMKDFTDELLDELSKIKCSDDEKKIKAQSDLVMGAFFSKLTEIETADMYKYEVLGEVIECIKYPGGSIREIKTKYSFKEREIKEHVSQGV